MYKLYTAHELAKDSVYTEKIGSSTNIAKSSAKSFRLISTRLVNLRTRTSYIPVACPRYLSTNLTLDTSIQHADSYIKVHPITGAVDITTGLSTCAAYGNDSIAAIFNALRPMTASGRGSLALTPVSSNTQYNILTHYLSSIEITRFLDSHTLKEDKKLLRFLSIYARIPFILLDPTLSSKYFAQQIKPANCLLTRELSVKKVHPTTGSISLSFIGFKFSPLSLMNPAMFWWHGVLVREALQLFFNYPEIVQQMIEACAGIKINDIINKHDWTAAKQVWLKIRPIILSRVASINSDSFAWFKTTRGMKNISSIMFFERLVASGGFTALRSSNMLNSVPIEAPTTKLSPAYDWKGEKIPPSIATDSWSNWHSVLSKIHIPEETTRLQMLIDQTMESWGHLNVTKFKQHAETAWGLGRWISQLTHDTRYTNITMYINAPTDIITNTDPLTDLSYSDLRIHVRHHLLQKHGKFNYA